MKQRGFVFAPFIPYIVGVVALALVVIWIYSVGHRHGAAKIQQKWNASVEALRIEEQSQAAKAATGLEVGNAKAKVVYRTITRTVDKIVDRPVYRNVCLDPDGLSAVNAALSGALTPAAEPDAKLPAADAPSRWFRGLRPPKAD